MSSEYRDKLQTLGFVAREHKTKKTRVRRDDTGATAGIQIEHKDGRVDAVATPEVQRLGANIEHP